MEEIHEQETGVDIIKAISSEEIPKIYANGFANFQGNADMGIIFQINGKPNVVVNMSFTLAKTLAEKIGQMIIDFEETTETEIMTTSVVDEKIHKKAKN